MQPQFLAKRGARMLTYTYSLVTLLVEQKKARKLLTEIQGEFQKCLCDRSCTNQRSFEAALDRLVRFDASHHRRNVDMFVIPAVQDATREADDLLEELDALSAMSARVLEQVCERMQVLSENDEREIRELCGAMECYCENLLERLEREEKELFPIAQRVISTDGWFRLASQFISHNEEIHRSQFMRMQQQAMEGMQMQHAVA
jgi:hemerythrin-like domain-containing protein